MAFGLPCTVVIITEVLFVICASSVVRSSFSPASFFCSMPNSSMNAPRVPEPSSRERTVISPVMSPPVVSSEEALSEDVLSEEALSADAAEDSEDGVSEEAELAAPPEQAVIAVMVRSAAARTAVIFLSFINYSFLSGAFCSPFIFSFGLQAKV